MTAMNLIELAKFNSFILDLQLSQFDRSSDLVAILTRDNLIFGILEHARDMKWNSLKSIKLPDGPSALAISPHSQVGLIPQVVRVAYADRTGIHIASLFNDHDDQWSWDSQLAVPGDWGATSMRFSDDGSRLAFSGGLDCRCHVLMCHNDGGDASSDQEVVSEPDSIAPGNQARYGSHSSVQLGSPGVCVRWHPTRSNYLVVAELAGTIRFLVASNDDDCDGDGDVVDDERFRKESFTCEYVINIGLKMPAPLTDIDFVVGDDKASFDFVVSSQAGLFVFALDKPLGTLEKMPLKESRALGYRRVQVGPVGGLLAAVGIHGDLVVSNIDETRVATGPASDCVAIAWHKQRSLLLAASIDTLWGTAFS